VGVILDSSAAIHAEREHLNVAQFLKGIAQAIGDQELALCSISVAELAHGIYQANTPERKERRRTFLNELKAVVPVYPITEMTAELVGQVSGESASIGLVAPFADLLIGACALERGYAVATHNLRHFRKITNLKVLPL